MSEFFFLKSLVSDRTREKDNIELSYLALMVMVWAVIILILKNHVEFRDK